MVCLSIAKWTPNHLVDSKGRDDGARLYGRTLGQHGQVEQMKSTVWTGRCDVVLSKQYTEQDRLL